MKQAEQQYRDLLKSHDWYYNYSDSYSVWVRGKEQNSKLHDLRIKLDPDATIWNEIAPAEEFKIKKQEPTT